jgi:hypothetical protein
MTVNESITKAGLDENFNLQLARGQIYNHSHVHKYGFNSAVGTGDDTIWFQQGDYTWSSAAVKLKISSSSANDDGDPAGTGANTVTVEGLDGNYAEISETVTLDGTTPVETTATFLRTHRMFVATAGTGLTNAGVIYAADTGDTYGTPGVPDTATGIRSTIGAGEGQTLQAFYTVPAGYTAYMAQVAAGSVNGTNATTITLRAREEGGAFRTRDKFIVFKDMLTMEYPVPIVFSEKTDIEMKGDAAASTTDVAANFDLILVKN